MRLFHESDIEEIPMKKSDRKVIHFGNPFAVRLGRFACGLRETHHGNEKITHRWNFTIQIHAVTCKSCLKSKIMNSK